MFKKTLYLLPLLISIFHHVLSQDSLVRVKDLTYSSSFEKEILSDYFQGKKNNTFLLFMANGTLLNEDHLKNDNSRFFNYLKTLKADARFDGKKNDKKIKFLYDDIHKSFLQKYELQNKFEDIFYNGNYNCVSASALFALAFEDTGIPFALKEEPTHVYLIAYPQQERIVIETTTPQAGYRTLDQTFKETYVKMLKDQKMISQSEYMNQSTNSLFDKFYFNNQEEITITNLIGLQYANDAIYKIDDKKYEQAYYQLQKGYLFYPCEKIGYSMFIACAKAFDEQKDKNLKHAHYLAELLKFKKYGITNEEVKGEFARVCQKNLFDSYNKELLDNYYNVLNSAIKDTVLQKEITFYYQYENGRYLYNQARFKDAVPYFEAALKAKPHNLETTNIFISAITQSMSSQSSTEEMITMLEGYSVKHEDLRKNNIFNRLLESAYLEQVGRSYDFGNITTGEKYRSSFEIHRDKYPDVQLDSHLLGRAYSLAAVYYFKKGQVAKSKSILKKGLSYDPDNYELMVRQRMIN